MSHPSSFRYQPITGGFEVKNGTSMSTRPLYASHNHDNGRSRYLYYAGDRPDIAVSTAAKNRRKLGNLRFGIQDGLWFSECQNIIARYIWGRMEYEVTDPSFKEALHILYVRALEFDGLLMQITLPVDLQDRLVIASDAKQFVDQCFTLDNDENVLVSGVVTSSKLANTVYVALTTDVPQSKGLKKFLQQPQQVITSSIEYFYALAETIQVTTPDAYLNSAIPSQVVAMDAAWNKPTIMHGAIAWHTAHAGWRSNYGFTACGWHDRVQLNAQQYMKSQTKAGRITNFPNRDSRYNMGEVLVDQLIFDWLWTGDLEYMRQGAYDFIAKHLQHQEDYLKLPDLNLYENWLNAWNTDNKWHNGGAGIISSSYTWHAYRIMADIAERLAKLDDAKYYSHKAEQIYTDMQQYLWSQDQGLFGEYRDRFGAKRLHNAPDLSSIYTPIDVGLVNDFEGHQMLRYSEYALEDIVDLPLDGRIVWSSNWLPPVYSSMGLYPDELVNLLLGYYQMGKPHAAYSLLRGIISALYTDQQPGCLSHMLHTDGTNTGHRDFSDVTSMFVRTIIEGLFGIKCVASHGYIQIRPMFPREWPTASFKSLVCSYDYHWDGVTEELQLSSDGKHEYRVELLVRRTIINEVVVDGKAVEYVLRPSVDGTYLVLNLPAAKNATVKIVYGVGELPTITYNEVGSAGSYRFSVDRGTVIKVYDPQQVLQSSLVTVFESHACVKLNDKQGWHTFFVYVSVDEIEIWLPVDVELRPPLEIIAEEIVQENEQVYCQFALQNNMQESVVLTGLATCANSKTDFFVQVTAVGQSELIKILVHDPTSLTPGSNLITVDFTEDKFVALTKNLVDWELILATDHQMVDMDSYVNQNLADLHKNEYGERLDKFYWVKDACRTVLPNGRSWWETGRGEKALPVLEKLPAAGEVLVTEMEVPFKISGDESNNSVFTSHYDNFPTQIKIPIATTGRKLYFLFAVSTNHMQSQLENARVTVEFIDGTQQDLALNNPNNIDDWLSYQTAPYAKNGYIQDLGGGAHANILDLDFGESKSMANLILTCISNEVLAGLLAVTVVK